MPIAWIMTRIPATFSEGPAEPPPTAIKAAAPDDEAGEASMSSPKSFG
jgi:hypothetical protein